jgi:serine/threonine protein kinase
MEAFNNQQGIELRRGNRLGNYILLEYIGGGGEAQIWSVWDEQRKKIIALKIVSLLGQVIDPDSRALIEFTRQIDLIGDLDHPNILPFYESGTTQHQIYCGMRYISGGSLADRLMAGPFSPSQIPDPGNCAAAYGTGYGSVRSFRAIRTF